MKNFLMGLLLLAAGSASAQGRERAAGTILGGSSNNGAYEQRDRGYESRDDRYDKDSKDRDYRNDKSRYDSRSTYNSRDRYEADVRDLNRYYDERISSVQNDRRLRARERKNLVADLQRERQDRLRQLNDRYYASQRNNERYDSRYANNGRY
jgi:hypothetical protein